MKVKIMDWIHIKTPRGEAIIKEYVWSSDNKDLETDLNSEFGKTETITTHEQRAFDVAIFVLADQAVRKFGGEIVKIHKKTIIRKKSKEVIIV